MSKLTGLVNHTKIMQRYFYNMIANFFVFFFFIVVASSTQKPVRTRSKTVDSEEEEDDDVMMMMMMKSTSPLMGATMKWKLRSQITCSSPLVLSMALIKIRCVNVNV